MSELKKHLKRMGMPYSDEKVALAEIEGKIMGQLCSYRKENNLTQKQLATQLGISPKKLSKMENGKNCFSFREIIKLIYALGGSFAFDFSLPIQDPYQEIVDLMLSKEVEE